MNVTIKEQVHASTNPYKTVCGHNITKKCKPTGNKVTCSICGEREKKRFKEIQAYVKRLMEDESLEIETKMWRLVGHVEGGLR